MNVVLGSAFRNSEYYLGRYLDQVESLRELGHEVRVIAAEGDSSDATVEALLLRAEARNIPIQLLNVSHGGPWFGSTEAKERMVALSRVGNSIFEAVETTDEVLVYVESDLIWDAEVIDELVGHAAQQTEGFDVFAPLVFAGPAFYDVWAFRRDGQRFTPHAPYHPALSGFTEVDSAGSCLVMRTRVARTCRIIDDECFVGWCQDARDKGYKIAVHPRLRIFHPYLSKTF